MKIFSVRILSKQNGLSSSPRGIPVVTESGETNMETQDFSSDMKELTLDVMQTISDKNFLRVSRNNRLQHITEPAVKSSDLQEGSKVKITFTFNKKENTQLYLRTTAGQVMPEGVNILEAYGTTWTRNGFTGEFFSTDGQRLIIREGSELTVKKSASPKEVAEQLKNIETIAEPYKTDKNHDLIIEGLKRNIPANVTLALFSHGLDSITHSSERKIEIEDRITEFERVKDYFASDFPKASIAENGKISPEFITYYITSKSLNLEYSQLSELGVTEELKKTYGILGGIRTVGSYGTNSQLSETVKIMNDLTPEESVKLAKKIFRSGPATDLLIALDGGNGTMIKRMIALGYHEGGLKFGRQNPDPASGYNIGTFQIGGSRSTPEISMRKYQDCLKAGLELAKSYGIDASMESVSDPGQKDLMTHLGYINLQRGGEATFKQLSNPNLSAGEVIYLMSTKIQGGIDAIGKSVVSQMQNTRIDTVSLG